MSCPLAALANIAVLTASALPPAPEPVYRANISASSSWSPPLSPENVPSSATTRGVATSPSGRPVSDTAGPRVSRPMKKRAVHAYPCEGRSSSPDDMPDCGLVTVKPNKPNKKARKTVGRSDPRADGAGSPLPPSAAPVFEMKADQPSFPVMLLAIMSAPQNRDVITFLSDGRSFIVVHPDAMVRNVLPLHFAGNVPTYDQFLGLLKLWGFDTITDPQYPEVHVFRHHMFREGDWEACLEMKLSGDAEAEDGTSSIGSRSTTEPGRALADGSVGQWPASPRRARAKRKPASPRRLAKAGKARRPAPVIARSVTPPENNIVLHQDETSAEAQRWMMRSSSTLEQMTLATAETRRCLSLSRPRLATVAQPSSEEAALDGRPVLSAMYLRHVRRALSDRPHSSPEELASNAYPESRRGLPETHQRDPASPRAEMLEPESVPVTSGLTDAQVKMVTDDVVSAAVAALKGGRDSDSGTSLSPTSHLDAMTETFLERSNARRMQSRPAGIFTGLLDARTRVELLAQQRGGVDVGLPRSIPPVKDLD